MAVGPPHLVLPEFPPRRFANAARLRFIERRNPPIFTARKRADPMGRLDHAGRRWNRRPRCRRAIQLVARLLDGPLLRFHNSSQAESVHRRYLTLTAGSKR